jgi:hypothetical protein
MTRPDPRRRGLLQHTATALRAATVLALGTAVFKPLPVRAAAPTFDLPTLMQRMARRSGGQARFSEERTVSGFDSPLTASGTLSFEAPDRFTRSTEYPTRETMDLQGRTLRLQRGGRTRQMDLDAVPEVASLLDALRATLTGNTALLQKHFATTFSGNEAQWVLVLKPLDERLARQVQQIELVGQGADLRSIELRLTGGDRSLMLLEPLKPLKTTAAGPAASSSTSASAPRR